MLNQLTLTPPTPDLTLPRVTEIIRATESQEDRERLRRWQHKMDKIHGEGGADQARDQAAARGTNFHQKIQDYIVSGGTAPTFEDPKEQTRWERGIAKIDAFAPFIYGMEIPVENRFLGYRGTFDAIAFKECPSLIDWKTTNRMKREEWIEGYQLQITAYAMACEEYGLEIDTGHIIIFGPKRCQHFIVKIPDWKERWLKRLAAFATINA